MATGHNYGQWGRRSTAQRLEQTQQYTNTYTKGGTVKFLREIASVVTKYTSNSPTQILGIDGRKKKSRSVEFFTGLLQGKYAMDTDAARELYGTDASGVAYRKLKSRVKEQLYNTLFFLTVKQPRNSAVVEALYNCTKHAAIARILVALGARTTGIALVHRTLLQAQQAHLFDIVLQSARLLRDHYSLMGLEKQFDEYDRMVGAMLQIQIAEAESDRLKEKLIVKYARSTSKKSEFAGIAHTSVERLQELRKEYPTDTVMMNYFRVQSMYCQIAGEFSALVEVCDEAEMYYQEYPRFSTRIRLAEFALTKMVAFLHLRDYERGEFNAQRCMELYPRTNSNWFTFMEYYFLLCLHTQKFVRAVEVFHEVNSNPRLQNSPEFRLEKWRVNEGYLHYVFESGWETTHSENVDMFSKRFSLNKFLNEVPTYSKDKRGMNVSIIILQILFLLERGQLDAIASRTDALRVYSSRYLRKDDSYRSQLFIRMLLVVESKSFDYNKIVVATQGYRNRLLATTKGKHGTLDDTEIIPFELLWERILLRLQRGM